MNRPHFLRSFWSWLPYVLVLCFIFITAIKPPVDTDLGWHLKYGEYFFTTGRVLRDNIFSFLWTQYKWVQASWGYDIFLYQLFTNFGFLGISVAGAIFTVTIYIIITRHLPKQRWSLHLLLAVIFLSQGVPLYFTGLRSQTPSSLLFALIVVLLYPAFAVPTKNTNNKFLYIVPVVFLIWANLHGGFSLGLIVFGIMWISAVLVEVMGKILKRQQQDNGQHISLTKLGLILVASILSPLVNPWGMRIYEETVKHSTNRNLRFITEWAPIGQWKVESTIALFVVALVLFVAWRRKNSADIGYLLAFGCVTYLAFNALRFLIPFAIMAVYYLAVGLSSFSIQRRSQWILGAFLVGIVASDMVIFKHYFFPIEPSITSFTWDTFCMGSLCSEQISDIMRKNPPKGNGFHPYDMGGYLIWRVPEVKTFLDGRMPAWEDNGQTPPVVDGDRIIAETEPITWRRFDSQYSFQWAIVPSRAAITSYLDQLVKSNQWQRVTDDGRLRYYVKK